MTDFRVIPLRRMSGDVEILYGDPEVGGQPFVLIVMLRVAIRFVSGDWVTNAELPVVLLVMIPVRFVSVKVTLVFPSESTLYASAASGRPVRLRESAPPRRPDPRMAMSKPPVRREPSLVRAQRPHY